MFKFFDYVYFTVCRYYIDRQRSSPAISALAIISFLHMLNLFTLFFLFIAFLPHKPHLNKYLVGSGLSLILLILNGIRYNKRNFEVLNRVWGDEENRKRKQTAVVIYIILSMILCFGIVGYLGFKKW